MNVVVCIKQVPDTEAPIRVQPGGEGIEEIGLSFIMNYYDEHAVEEALRLREAHGGTVTLVCVGPARAADAVRTGLAMGADDAILITDAAMTGADHLAVARVLAAAIARLSWDVILCGRLATDDNAGVTGPALAEYLGAPQATAITRLEIADRSATVAREVEGGMETWRVALPAVFTVERTINEPRYPTLPGIMKAKRKEIKTLDLAGLGLDPREVGGEAARTSVVRLAPPASRSKGRTVDGADADAAAQEIVTFLRDVAKVL